MPISTQRLSLPDRLIMAQAATPRLINIDRDIPASSISMTSQKVIYSGFTPLATVTASTLSTFVRATAAATTTLARMGVYTVAADGSITLVARTASSTTLGNATFAAAALALDTTGGYPASYTFQQGLRYAFAAVWVATTPPALYGSATPTSANGVLPWLCMSQTGQSALPTSVAIGSLTAESGLLMMAAY